MGAYISSQKLLGELSKKVGGGYLQNKKVWSSNIPNGTSLFSYKNKNYFAYNGNEFKQDFLTDLTPITPTGVKNTPIELTVPISKTHTGLQLLISSSALMRGGRNTDSSGNYNNQFSNFIDNYNISGHLGTAKIITPLNIPKSELGSGKKYMIFSGKGSNSDYGERLSNITVELMDDSHLKFSADDGTTFENSTFLGYSVNGGGSASFLIIDDIVSY